jgi:hypothetical protein
MYSQLIKAGTAFALAVSAIPAMATITLVTNGVDGTYTQLEPRTPGVYGVELRFGDSGNAATWEIGAGSQTSVSGSFQQAQFNWGSGTGVHDFSLTWDAAGLSITVGGTTVTSTAALVGNTLNVGVKRDATLFLDTINGQSLGLTFNGPAAPASQDNFLFFGGLGGWAGNALNATGTVRIGSSRGTGSASEIFFSGGNFAPNGVVPEPATWAMLIAGFGMVGTAMRRRRTAVAA